MTAWPGEGDGAVTPRDDKDFVFMIAALERGKGEILKVCARLCGEVTGLGGEVQRAGRGGAGYGVSPKLNGSLLQPQFPLSPRRGVAAASPPAVRSERTHLFLFVVARQGPAFLVSGNKRQPGIGLGITPSLHVPAT